MAEADLPGCFGPYLRYAITTDYKYFESFDEKDFRLFLLVEYLVDETTDHAAAFETEMDDSQYLDHKPGIEFAPIDPDSQYVSKYTTMRTLKAAVERHTFSSWNTHVSRVELSLPVQRPPTRFAKKAPLRNRKPSHYPPTDVLIGVIDDGCPFAAAHFAKFVLSAAAGTRVRGIWDQNRGRFPISVDSNTQFGEFLTDFNYGLEFLRDSEPPNPGIRTIGLNDWIGLHSTTAGSVDEDGCYAEAEFNSLLSQYSHGAHVHRRLCLGAGLDEIVGLRKHALAERILVAFDDGDALVGEIFQRFLFHLETVRPGIDRRLPGGVEEPLPQLRVHPVERCFAEIGRERREIMLRQRVVL